MTCSIGGVGDAALPISLCGVLLFRQGLRWGSHINPSKLQNSLTAVWVRCGVHPPSCPATYTSSTVWHKFLLTTRALIFTFFNLFFMESVSSLHCVARGVGRLSVYCLRLCVLLIIFIFPTLSLDTPIGVGMMTTFSVSVFLFF